MFKKELLELCSGYIIADTELCKLIKSGDSRALIIPAIPEYCNDNLFLNVRFNLQEDMLLYYGFCDGNGNSIKSGFSPFGIWEHLYVREAYWRSGDKINYFADGAPAPEEKVRVLSGKYMRKSHSRLFLRISNIKLLRLHDISISERAKAGFYTKDELISWWERHLSERQSYFCKFDDNPYVFYYEFDKLIPERELK